MKLSEKTPLPFHRLWKPWIFSSSPQAFGGGSILPGCTPIAISSDATGVLRMTSVPVSEAALLVGVGWRGLARGCAGGGLDSRLDLCKSQGPCSRC